MIPAAAIAILLDRYEAMDVPVVALSPEDYEGSGLPIKRRLIAEDGTVVFYYVDRLQLIQHFRQAYNLHKKGTSVNRIIQGI